MPAADAGTDAWSAWLTTRTTDQLDAARDLVAALKAERPRRAADAPRALERHQPRPRQRLRGGQPAPAGASRRRDPRAGRGRPRSRRIELLTDLSLDREVYDLMVVDDAEASGSPASTTRPSASATSRSATSAAPAWTATRPRATGVRAINERETELGQTFERNIRDDDTTVKVRPEQLDGLPADWVESHPVGRRRPRRADPGVPRRGPDADRSPPTARPASRSRRRSTTGPGRPTTRCSSS